MYICEKYDFFNKRHNSVLGCVIVFSKMYVPNFDTLRRKTQIKYFLRFLDVLPQGLSSQENTR